MANASTSDDTYAHVIEAAQAIARRHAERPRVAVVLGTGLGGLADQIERADAIPYTDIPHFPHSTVAGHAGRLVLGTLRGVPVAAMQGRFHLYEGYEPDQVTFPIRVLHQLGADVLIVTNASGGLAPDLKAGDLLLMRDHIGLPTMAARNPLIGPNDERFGPRFPPMTGAYDDALRTLARDAAAARGLALREGTYAMVSGPNYESPAELRFLRAAGADAVGMSTVPEVLVARHMGMRVLAISCVTNAALRDADEDVEPDHAAVVAAANAVGERLAALVSDVLDALPQPPV